METNKTHQAKIKKSSEPKKVSLQEKVVSGEHESLFDRYAIFQTGGKQYQALVGKTVAIEKIEGEEGKVLEFKEVLFRKSGSDVIEVGKPFLEGAVKASIVKQMRGPKVIVFKFKRRKKSRVKKGHRQPITVIRIDSI